MIFSISVATAAGAFVGCARARLANSDDLRVIEEFSTQCTNLATNETISFAGAMAWRLSTDDDQDDEERLSVDMPTFHDLCEVRRVSSRARLG